MNATLSEIQLRFIKNRDVIAKAFPMENSMLYPACAALFLNGSADADVHRLKECKKILKQETGMFSAFQGMGTLPILCLMSLSENPAERFRKANDLYQKLRQHFFSSAYLPLASVIVSELAPESQYEAIALRTRGLYNRMKKEHPWLTSDEDSSFAALMALSQKSDDDLIRDAEYCYEQLKNTFKSPNALQSLTHALILCDTAPDPACKKTVALFGMLKDRGRRYGTEHQLPTLGVLANAESPLEVLCEEILQSDQFLKTQKGYGFFGLDKTQRLMHAGMLVLAAQDTTPSQTSAGDTAATQAAIAAAIAAQQAAMCAVIAATTAANAANAASH